MNVFLHELRARLKSNVWWLVSLAVFMAASVAKFDALNANAAASQALLGHFPATIQAVFGMTGLDLTTVSGYYGVLFLYLLVIVAVHAGLLGAGLVADEERDHTAEFLLVKPRSRASLLTPKLWAGLMYIVLLWLVVVASSIIGVHGVSNLGTFVHDFRYFMAGLGVIQLTMFALGLAAASILRQPKLAGRVVSIIIFSGYLIVTFVKLVPSASWLHYAALFGYFDAAQIIKSGTVPAISWIVLSVLGVAVVVAAYVGYQRRDVNI